MNQALHFRALRAIALWGCCFGTLQLSAQTASNACGYDPGNQYAVTASCTNQTFNKPSSFSNAFTPSGCSGSGNNDAWGWFTATGHSTIITFTPGSGNPILHLFSGACGSLTQLACANNGGGGAAETIVYPTTPGTNYLVRMQASGTNNTLNGNICIHTPAPPANDEPCGAALLSVNTSCSNSSTTSLHATPSTSVPAPPCGNFGGRDVWYRFVAGANRSVRIRTSANGLTDSGVALYEASSCSAGFNLLGCAADGNGSMAELGVGGLTQGSTYYIRVWGEDLAQGTFNICLISVTGDEPCNASAIGVSNSCSTVSVNTTNATANPGIPDPPCGNFQGGDLWYRFTAPTNGAVTVRTTAGGISSTGVALYSAATCSAPLTLLACDGNGNGSMGQLGQGGLTPGATYYIRVWGKNGTTGTFNLCVVSVVNDEPCGATSLGVNTSCSSSSSTNVFASGSPGVPAPPCGNYTGGDVWFSFVANANRSVRIRTLAGSLTDSGVALYAASSCGAGYALLGCAANGNGSMGELSLGGLTQGTTYYVRVWGENGATGSFNICLIALDGDEPCNANSIGVSNTCSTIAVNTTNATANPGIPDPPCGNFQGGDLWYRFTAPTNGAVTVRTTAGGISSTGVALYSAATCSAPLTLLACDGNGNGNMGQLSQAGLTPGAAYYVRVWGKNGTTGSFNLCVVSVVNDEPCGATSLGVNTSCSSSSSTNVLASASPGVPAPPCGNYAGGDVWFSFVANSSRSVYIRTLAGTLTSAGVALYSAASCSNGYTLLGCSNSGNGTMGELGVGGLTSGTTYYVRVWGENGTTGSFNICLVGATGDDPCAPINLGVNSSCSNTSASTAFTTSNPGFPDPPCGNYQGGDVWFTFVAPAGGAVGIRTSSGGLTDSGVALYSASSCATGFQPITCSSGGNGSMGVLSAVGLTPGTTYYVRVWGEGGNPGTFSICAFTVPANDDPCGAVNLPVNTSCVNTASSNSGTTATIGVPDPDCANYQGGDVWFRFVAPASGAVNIETSANSLNDSGIALYSATNCGNGFSLLACDDDAGPGFMSRITSGGLTPGTTYFIRVWGFAGTAGSFNICVSTVNTAPNDEPCNAIALPLGGTCTFASYTNANATGSIGIPAPGCGGYSGADVWFRFTAPQSGLVTIRTTAGTLTNAAMALYRANACNSGLSLVSCDNTSGPGNMPFLSFTLLDLIPGDVYYLRVWGNGGTIGTFNLCANTAPSGGTCTYALHLFDSQGDGWNGSRVTVQVGTNTPVNYTITNSDRETFYIPVTTGQNVTLSYTAAGGGQGEIRYVLQSFYGAIYQDGPTPGTGLRYAGVVDCVSPPAAPSDCYGRVPLCSGQQVSDNPTNTGLTADLHLNNRGCLGTNERQGSWYSFSMANGGTVGLTIAPTNPNDDYDFSIWGPFNTLSCPPLDTPLRCNYSGTPGPTGLSTAGINASEGGGGLKWSTPMNVATGDMFLLYVSNFSQSGLSFDLTWQLTNGADISCSVLPVELLSFGAIQQHASSLVEWTTASESNSSHFVVERAGEDLDLQPIGTLTAQGTTSNLSHYSFVDHQPLPGTNYYRLRQVDQDGHVTYSELAVVHFGRPATLGALYPNPTTDAIHLDVTLTEPTALDLHVLDMSGRTVMRTTTAYSEGPQRLTTTVSQLMRGTYLLHVLLPSGEMLHAGRFVVQ